MRVNEYLYPLVKGRSAHVWIDEFKDTACHMKQSASAFNEDVWDVVQVVTDKEICTSCQRAVEAAGSSDMLVHLYRNKSDKDRLYRQRRKARNAA